MECRPDGILELCIQRVSGQQKMLIIWHGFDANCTRVADSPLVCIFDLVCLRLEYRVSENHNVDSATVARLGKGI